MKHNRKSHRTDTVKNLYDHSETVIGTGSVFYSGSGFTKTYVLRLVLVTIYPAIVQLIQFYTSRTAFQICFSKFVFKDGRTITETFR